MAVISAFSQSQGMDHFSIELLNNAVNGIERNMGSLNSAHGGILSGPSYLVELSVLNLIHTAAEVMTTSSKHTPSEMLAQFSDGILSND